MLNKFKRWLIHILLTEYERKHIEQAMREHYSDEWCSVCDLIAEKFGFEPPK